MKYWLVLSILFLGIVVSAQNQGEIEKQIDEIIKELTLEEKVKMCHAQSKFSSPGVERLGIPEIWMSDGPHGVRAEIEWDSWSYAGWTNDSCTAFPALTCLASTFNPDLAYKYGVAIGEEARYRKKDILLGPGVNIYRTPLNGRNFEYMGEDPYLASVMCVPYIKGVQTNGVAACVKHYALNNQEVWRGHINVKISDRALHEIYLPAYKAAVREGGVWSIMGAYNKYNGQHTSHHEVLINGILKGAWAFDGVVVTDWGSAHDTREAALNGLDIEMGTGTDGLTSSTENAYDHYYLAKPFLELLKSGEIDESVVDDKVRRILRLMYRTNIDKNRPFGRKANQLHFNVAREVAQEGIVLLKNNKSFLPLNPETTQTIAVIGENATRMMTVGGGSSELKTVHEISPLHGIQQRFTNANIIHSMGYASGPSQYGRVIPSDLDQDSLKQAAIETAKKADVVLFVGGLNKNHEQDCENGDRKSLNLPFGQDELLDEIVAVNKNVVVVLVSGNAVTMPWQAKAKAIVQAWYLGSESGYAIADVLSGDVNPSGKLPFSFPVKLEDNGAHAFDELSYPGDGTDQVYKEDILVGYRWHDTKKIKPLYAFGYGLSYTTFKINSASVNAEEFKAGDEISLSVELSNVGQMAGSEVLQVYVRDEKSSVMRPHKELKGFKKVQLAAGQTQTIELSVAVDSFAFYDENNNDWKLEKGNYQLLIGTASNNIKKTIKVAVK
ncbi:beta-glucosidase [Carboxylicivirga marina]|uniref:beta-glucosidase n=1 Tax=Carboxylicivirga marina TaxID=2800988 RepID=UPI0025966FD1|nr:glycoside hydrolase family 3 C-terminal domain-containing protein [uncultured Carboxylicivirga sp.]